MEIWLVFLAMTAVAVVAVLWPLSRKPKAAAGGNDIAVYRDQLDEIERDKSLGAIGPAEAEAAKTEVSRRLLAAADADKAAGAPVAEPVWRRRAVGLATLVLVPVGAASLYLWLGSPELPNQPLAERLARVHAGVPMPGSPQGQAPGSAQGQGQAIEALVARVETYLQKNPEDGRGWEVIAPVYMRIGNYDAAAQARANALRLLGATADREADHGEALVFAADGEVTADARAAFERSLKLDAQNVSARFYLALAARQDGKTEEAISRWQAMLADAPADATWPAAVRAAIARAQGKPEPTDVAQLPPGHPGVAQPAAAPPQAAPPQGAQQDGERRTTTSDVASAIGIAPQAAAPQVAAGAAAMPQQDMIRGMVARLAERLKQDGSDVEGWLRLVRSYVVLGDPDKARAAAADARAALSADPEKLRQLNAGVKELGLEG